MAAENYFLAMLVALNSLPLSHCTGSLSHMLVWQSFELHSLGVSRRKEWSNVHESAQRESQTVETHIQELVQIHIWQHNSLINASEVKSNKNIAFSSLTWKIAKHFYEFGNGFRGTQEETVFLKLTSLQRMRLTLLFQERGAFPG